MTLVLPYVKEQAASVFMQFTRITKENGSSYDHRSYERKFKQFRIEAWKRQDFNGVWTRDLAIPVRRSNRS